MGGVSHPAAADDLTVPDVDFEACVARPEYGEHALAILV